MIRLSSADFRPSESLAHFFLDALHSAEAGGTKGRSFFFPCINPPSKLSGFCAGEEDIIDA